MNSRSLTWSAAGCALLAMACERGDESEGMPNVEDVSGYPLVTFSGIPTPPEPLSAPVLTYGEPGSEFGSISDLAVTPEGDVVVLDYQASQVRRFRPDGSRSELLAGQGQGPGEIGRAIGLAVDALGTVWVYDYGNGRLTGLRGGTTKDVPFSATRLYGLQDGGAGADGELWFLENHSGPFRALPAGVSDFITATWLVRISTETGEAIDSIFLGSTEERSVGLPNGRGGRPLPYGRERLVAVNAGAAWTAVSDDYRLVRVDLASGDTTLVIRVDMDPTTVPDEERAAVLEDLAGWLSENGVGADGLESEVPEHFPLIDRIAADPDGNVWVQRRRLEGTTVEVFSADGYLLGRYLSASTPWEHARLAAGHGVLATVLEDEFGALILAIWTVRGNGAV